jgi:hypothetical protein
VAAIGAAIYVITSPSLRTRTSADLARAFWNNRNLAIPVSAAVGVALILATVGGTVDLLDRRAVARVLADPDPCAVTRLSSDMMATVNAYEPTAISEKTESCNAKRTEEAAVAREAAYVKGCSELVARLDAGQPLEPTGAEVTFLKERETPAAADLARRIGAGAVQKDDLKLEPGSVPCRKATWPAFVTAAARSAGAWGAVTSAEDVSPALKAALLRGAAGTDTSKQAATRTDPDPVAVTTAAAAKTAAPSTARAPAGASSSSSKAGDRTACLRQCIASCKDDAGCERTCAAQKCR